MKEKGNTNLTLRNFFCWEKESGVTFLIWALGYIGQQVSVPMVPNLYSFYCMYLQRKILEKRTTYRLRRMKSPKYIKELGI